MTIRLNNIVLDIDDCVGDNIDAVKTKAAKIMRVDFSEIKECRIAKESIDARKKITLSLIMQFLLKLIMKKR